MQRWIRFGLLGVVAASLLLGIVVEFVPDGVSWEGLLFSGAGLLIFLLAALLVTRVPDNRLSWTLLAVSFGLSLAGLFGIGGAVGDWIILIGLFGLLLPGIGVFVPLWFPTGHPPSRRWRWVGWMAALGVATLILGTAVEQIRGEGLVQDIESCTGLGPCIVGTGVVAVLVAIPIAIVSLIVRWVRSEGIQRQQMKWLIPAFIALGIGVVVEFGVSQDSLVGTVFLNLGMVLVPICIAIAVLKYRLYEIDKIISRTMSYGLVVALLGGVFAALTWLPGFLIGGASASGRNASAPPVIIAASTLAVAALFNPIRKRVQHAVDRRFNRSGYQADTISEQFAARLQDSLTVEEIAATWTAVVEKALQPEATGIWIGSHQTERSPRP